MKSRRRPSKLAGKLVGLTSRQRAKAAKRICIRPHCRNIALAGRVCHTHRSREKFARHPLLRLFHNLKSHAKARKKPFSLTYEWFKAWANRSGYDRLHGRKGECLTVDRRDHKKGYVVGNVHPLTHAANSRKGWYERHGKPWESAEVARQDDMKRKAENEAREVLIADLHAAFHTETQNALLNRLCDEGFASESAETLDDVAGGDLIRALNSRRKAA